MDFSGGVDSGRVTSIQVDAIPNGLPRNMLSWLQNGTVRGCGIMPRTGWLKRAVAATGQTELFQGLFLYQPNIGYPYIIASIGGRILKIEPDTGTVTDLSALSGVSNPATPPKAYFCQANAFLVIQAGDYGNGDTLPLFWDGTTLRRSIGITNTGVVPGTPGVNEIPAAEMMVYYQNRLWYAQGRTVSAGDISGGNSGTAPYDFTDAVLNVTENPLCVGGDGFSVPTDAGNLTALAYTANLDTNLGQGPLYLFTRQQVYALAVPLTRTAWINTTGDNAPSMTIAQIRYGACSDRSVVHSNGDLYYQTMEPGIRSLILALRYYSQFGNTPISKNVRRAIGLNDRSLLDYACGIEFDNRMWQTCLPIETPVGVAHQGIVVLDFDLMSSLQDKLKETAVPAWEGMYEPGLTLQLCEEEFGGLQRAFAALWFPETKTIEIWEPTSYAKSDNDGSRIPMLIETPAYNWNTPFAEKELETMQLWLDEIVGTVDFQVWFRQDADPCWHAWTAFRICTQAQESTQAYPAIYCPQGQLPVTLPKAPGFDCDALNKRPCNIGCQFQVKMFIKGWCRVRGMMAYALPRESRLYEGMVCPPPNTFTTRGLK
jgi:hypothetical protein